ncbi:glutamyl-tRNA reductase [Cutibacterium acnes JCM 18909]|nr:glutamyl-tRNA reductase [Cutibacterium acnes JCM 18909]
MTVDHAEQGLGVVSEAAAQIDGLGLALTDHPDPGRPCAVNVQPGVPDR